MVSRAILLWTLWPGASGRGSTQTLGPTAWSCAPPQPRGPPTHLPTHLVARGQGAQQLHTPRNHC